MIPTIRLYMTNPEQLMSEALVIQILDENHRKVLTLDKTPFYPQGGGQPYDKGVIESSNAFFEVEEVRVIDDCVKHYGQFVRGHFTPNQSAYCKVDAKRRHQHNCLHSAGHVVDMAVFKLGLNWTPEKGHHFPDNSYVEYSGTLENMDKERLKESIETTCNKLIQEDHKTSIRFVSHAELKHLCHFLPSYISEADQKIRLVVFGKDFYIPCGGTHVQALSEIPKITVRKIKMEKGKVRVSYAMMNE